MDEVEAVHLRSLLSLLYNGWADAESTGGLIQLWKQLGITLVRLAPPTIQVVNETAINVTDDIFMQRRGTLKESRTIAVDVDEGKGYQETRIAEVDVEELDELIKDAEVEETEVEFEELEKGRLFEVKASSKGEEVRGIKRNRGAEEVTTLTTTRKRERLLSKEEALPKEKKREIVVRNLEEREKEELRVEQVKVETVL